MQVYPRLRAFTFILRPEGLAENSSGPQRDKKERRSDPRLLCQFHVLLLFRLVYCSLTAKGIRFRILAYTVSPRKSYTDLSGGFNFRRIPINWKRLNYVFFVASKLGTNSYWVWRDNQSSIYPQNWSDLLLSLISIHADYVIRLPWLMFTPGKILYYISYIFIITFLYHNKRKYQIVARVHDWATT